MPENRLELDINNFRAIQKARIALNGITVISGENGCGKSTISKMMYHSVQAINLYDEIAYKPLLAFYKEVIDTFTDVLNDIFVLKSISKIFKLDENLYSIKNIPDILETIKATAQALKDSYHTTIKNTTDKELSQFFNRLKTILLDTIDIKENKERAWDSIIDEILEVVYHEKAKIESKITERNIDTFISTVSFSFNNENITNKINLYEHEVCVTNSKTKRLLNFSSINKVLYIDTPMAVGLPDTNIQHWNYLNNILRGNKGDIQSNISQAYHFLSDEILGGEATFDSRSLFGRFTYQRKDGQIFNLLDCATGIKAFAILQILLKNGYLDDKTLLIIDEPEAHLHPQWIVEYAHIIALLNKELGVNFLIASHNPDMISALKYISEKENVAGNLNFYLAEKGDKETYTYKALGTGIDDIFGSFNIAIDRINLYGALENEIF